MFRYKAGDAGIRAVIGEIEPDLPQDDLIAHAAEALASETFVCYAVSQHDDFVADELCFVPQGDRCDILSMRTNGWKRHHGDHRRSLVEILNNLAAAVACGKLRILDASRVAAEAAVGEAMLELRHRRLGGARRGARGRRRALTQAGVEAAARQRPSSASPRPSPTCCCTAAATAA